MELERVRVFEIMFQGWLTHAIGLALLHLLNVGSPKAVIFLLSPSKSVQRESFLTWSNDLLKWAVLLSSEKTSVYMT